MWYNRAMHRILTKVSGKGMNSNLSLVEGVREGFLGWGSLKAVPKVKSCRAIKQMKLLEWKDSETTFLVEKKKIQPW